jgi:hypothetical protein
LLGATKLFFTAYIINIIIRDTIIYTKDIHTVLPLGCSVITVLMQEPLYSSFHYHVGREKRDGIRKADTCITKGEMNRGGGGEFKRGDRKYKGRNINEIILLSSSLTYFA